MGNTLYHASDACFEQDFECTTCYKWLIWQNMQIDLHILMFCHFKYVVNNPIMTVLWKWLSNAIQFNSYFTSRPMQRRPTLIAITQVYMYRYHNWTEKQNERSKVIHRHANIILISIGYSLLWMRYPLKISIKAVLWILVSQKFTTIIHFAL